MKIEQASVAKSNPVYAEALVNWLYQLADDELVIGHRDSEWLGMCPDIEGDVAFSSIAQDEVGHANFYFTLLHELGEKDPDALAFSRPANSRRNALLLEHENHDWAYSVVRHMFYDLWDELRLKAFSDSSYFPLSRGAARMLREEYYHSLHMTTWFVQLGSAGGEAKEKMNAAIRKIWPDLGDLFYIDQEKMLLQFGIIQESSASMKEKWEEQIKGLVQKAGLTWPGPVPGVQMNGRLGEHSDDLKRLIETMGEVYTLDPAAKW
ncbi:1,2-phenylacetyl-CoA epoxidase subunit PaaC [Thermoactinomyces mirandus]|uniref:Phenylacetate-CoA oxygenase subunit PaaC n=1 Tax=Thermoactinomyces mirandus TaxID=2756294 RepID=A0A7W1XRD6_9BACL|nr:1,2-phenylacetyl-CoA epoxidase subunit PaaC [Thermoactinomyces mirandus]MBA4601902.1 phenylacetate-CoA oxygenase subunit PaaC [Thermoactinomyces mirandus]